MRSLPIIVKEFEAYSKLENTYNGLPPEFVNSRPNTLVCATFNTPELSHCVIHIGSCAYMNGDRPQYNCMTLEAHGEDIPDSSLFHRLTDAFTVLRGDSSKDKECVKLSRLLADKEETLKVMSTEAKEILKVSTVDQKTIKDLKAQVKRAQSDFDDYKELKDKTVEAPVTLGNVTDSVLKLVAAGVTVTTDEIIKLKEAGII